MNFYEGENLITGIYVRVSTEEQAREGFSINAQKEKLKQYALARDWDVFDFYIDDGISGKNIKDRPEALRLIKNINEGKINNVLVYKIDRLTRSTKNLIELIELFAEKKCAFNSLMESIDTTSATGRMFIKIVGIFAEFERENLAERVSFGYEQKTREGNYTNANGVFGYDYIIGEGNLIVNEFEKEVIKTIFELYLSGTGMSAICRYLIEKKVPTKRGGKWCQSTISSILTNPLYIGKVRYDVSGSKNNSFTVDSDHEKIIDEEIFYRVQEITSKRKKYKTRKYASENTFFCGTLVCAKCGARLTSYQHRDKNVKTGKVYGTYRCINSKNGNCSSGGFSHSKMEATFIDYISKIENFAPEISEVKKENNDKKIEALKKAIEKSEKRVKEIRNLFMQEKLSFEEYREFSNGIEEQLLVLNEELNQIVTKEEEEINFKEIKGLIGNLKNNWIHLTSEEKVQFMFRFISHIKVCRDNGEIIISEIKFINNKKSVT